MKVKVKGSQYELEENIKDNFNVRYRRSRETNFTAENYDSPCSMKCKSSSPGDSVCSKSMPRTTSMQGITFAEKPTLPQRIMSESR